MRKVGNSLGLTLPQEALEKLKVQEGDSVFVTETPAGVMTTSYHPGGEQAREAYRKVSTKYRNALHELGK
ncbi:MAG: AbrB/MazE/SpoVT family DNA-binding domain-containing protein [Dolichospermum sp.]